MDDRTLEAALNSIAEGQTLAQIGQSPHAALARSAVNHFRQDAITALATLATISPSPENIDTIRDLQMQITVYSKLLTWVQSKIVDGKIAAQQVSREEADEIQKIINDLVKGEIDA